LSRKKLKSKKRLKIEKQRDKTKIRIKKIKETMKENIFIC